MDKERLPLPRFAYIGASRRKRKRSTTRSDTLHLNDDEDTESDSDHSATAPTDERNDPPIILLPIQPPAARHQPVPPPAQPVQPHSVDSKQVQRMMQPMAASSQRAFDDARYEQASPFAQLDISTAATATATATATTATTTTSIQQHHAAPIAPPSKPKKLHKEVEQKRRMRMTEQIEELRKSVCNPNAGKSDKVSVLQDAVSYVKDARSTIDGLREKTRDLQAALDQERAENARLNAENSTLRSLLGSTPLPAPPQRVVSAQPVNPMHQSSPRQPRVDPGVRQMPHRQLARRSQHESGVVGTVMVPSYQRKGSLTGAVPAPSHSRTHSANVPITNTQVYVPHQQEVMNQPPGYMQRDAAPLMGAQHGQGHQTVFRQHEGLPSREGVFQQRPQDRYLLERLSFRNVERVEGASVMDVYEGGTNSDRQGNASNVNVTNWNTTRHVAASHTPSSAPLYLPPIPGVHKNEDIPAKKK